MSDNTKTPDWETQALDWERRCKIVQGHLREANAEISALKQKLAAYEVASEVAKP